MLTRVDHIAIAVEDPESALRFYRDLLGLDTHTADGTLPGGASGVVLPAGGSAIALVEAASAEPYAAFVVEHGEGIHHLAFESDSGDDPRGLLPREDHHGAGIAVVGPGEALRFTASPGIGVENIDHVVVASVDSARMAAHFRDSLGLEIKRAMTRPGTGAHLEFAKLGDVIIEFAGPPEPREGPLKPRYFGIVFTVTDIHDAIARTRAAGIRCDDPKPAVQPGALIAGIKEATGGVPVALIQYNARNDA